jgi:uncharacterized lipoprotein YmbA
VVVTNSKCHLEFLDIAAEAIMALRLTASQHRNTARLLLQKAQTAPKPHADRMRSLAASHLSLATYLDRKADLAASAGASATLH